MITIIQAIKSLNPNAGVRVGNNHIDDIKWLDGTTPIPKAEIEAEVARLESEYDANQYQRTRATEYPALAEQLDLLFHDMTAGKGTKSGNWYKAVNKVKTDNPKPE